jgi:hypothetical protein
MRMGLLFFFFLLAFTQGCKKKCDGKRIHVGLVYAWANDHLLLYCDDVLVAERKIEKIHKGQFRSKKDKLTEICADEKPIKMRVVFNNTDTSFYFQRDSINECWSCIECR